MLKELENLEATIRNKTKEFVKHAKQFRSVVIIAYVGKALLLDLICFCFAHGARLL